MQDSVAGVVNVASQCIDNRVPDDEDPFLGDAFLLEILLSTRCGGKEPIGDMIEDYSVELLCVAVVEIAQSGLHMKERDMQLQCRKCSWYSGIQVTVHKCEVWSKVCQNHVVHG